MNIFPHDAEDLDILTRTVYGEARGEGQAGWTAVAWVIRNRAANPSWWGRSISTVCLDSMQFDCWMPSDPNYSKIKALPATDVLYRQIQGVCIGVLNGTMPDQTGCADHYEVIGTNAAWAVGKTPSAIIGHQAFYVLGPSA